MEFEVNHTTFNYSIFTLFPRFLHVTIGLISMLYDMTVKIILCSSNQIHNDVIQYQNTNNVAFNGKFLYDNIVRDYYALHGSKWFREHSKAYS